jgi:holo-[acyl-carrier protein] synthase
MRACPRPSAGRGGSSPPPVAGTARSWIEGGAGAHAVLLGLGIDLVEVERVERQLEKLGDSLLDEVLCPGEIAYCRGKRRPGPHIAARFAAKEALLKALGTGRAGRISWHDAEVVHDERGRPSFVLAGETARLVEEKGTRAVHLTLTHTDTHASAMVALEG